MAKKTSRTPTRKSFRIGSIRVELTIALVGILLSIALHELLHIVLHWHQIVGIRFFPNVYTVAEVIVDLPVWYDLAAEEFIGYSITAGVLIITAIIIAQVHDRNDKRTVRQILFPELSKPAKPTASRKKKK